MIECVKAGPNFFFNYATIGAFFQIFWILRSFFWVGVRFKNFFETYLCRQSMLILEAQPYLFVFNLITFGASFTIFWAILGYLFGLLGLFLGLESGSENFWNLLMQTFNFCFGSAALLLFLIRPNLAPFCTFMALQSYFWGCCQVKHFFRTYLCRQ